MDLMSPSPMVYINSKSGMYTRDSLLVTCNACMYVLCRGSGEFGGFTEVIVFTFLCVLRVSHCTVGMLRRACLRRTLDRTLFDACTAMDIVTVEALSPVTNKCFLYNTTI